MRRFALTFIAVLLFALSPAFADEVPPPPQQAGWITVAANETAPGGQAGEKETGQEPEQAETLEPVIVTATRIETPVNRIGSSVTVITREQLEELGTNSIIEALRQAPGLTIRQTGGKGGTTSVSTRGSQSEFTLVMIDGVELTDAGGRSDLAHITIDNVERIEVVRGPQSALYGADALAGVINIITRKGAGKPRLEVSGQGGNLDNNLESASLSGSDDSLNYSVSASHFGTENKDDIMNDRYNNLVVSARAGFQSEDDLDLSFIFRYQNAHVENPGPTEFLPEDPDDALDTRNVTFTAIYNQQLKDWWSHSLQASYFEQQLNASDPAAQDLFNDAAFDNNTVIDRVEVNYKHDFHIFQDHVITVGADWQQEQADIVSSDEFSGTTTIDEGRHNLGLFAQAALSFWNRLDIVAGVRRDDNSVFGDEVTPRFSASYLVRETGTRLKGSYGEGIKNPTFLDLFFDSPPFFFGNPDLKPEKNKAWDLGVEQTVLDGALVFGATYFRTDYDDLINIVETEPFVYTPENIDTAVSKGVELTLTAQLPHDFTLRGAYTFTETEDNEGDDLKRIPKHLLSLNLNYTHQKVMVNLDATYAGERPDINFAFVDNNGDFVNDITETKADEYVKIDLAGEYKLNDNVSIVASVENLLNDDIEEVLGFENPGISVLAGVRAVF